MSNSGTAAKVKGVAVEIVMTLRKSTGGITWRYNMEDNMEDNMEV
jgi:hypothetical protein